MTEKELRRGIVKVIDEGESFVVSNREDPVFLIGGFDDLKILYEVKVFFKYFDGEVEEVRKYGIMECSFAGETLYLFTKDSDFVFESKEYFDEVIKQNKSFSDIKDVIIKREDFPQ